MKKRIIGLVIAMAILVGILPTVLPPLKVSALTASSEKHSVDTSKLTMPTVIKFYRSDNGNVEKKYTIGKNTTFTFKTKNKDGKDGSASYKDGVLTLTDYTGGAIYADGDIVIMIDGEDNEISSCPNAGYKDYPGYLLYSTGSIYIMTDKNAPGDLTLECGSNDVKNGRDAPNTKNGFSHIMAENEIFIYDTQVIFENNYTKNPTDNYVCTGTVANTMAKSTNIENSWIYSYGGFAKRSESDVNMSLGDLFNVRIVDSVVESDAGIFMFSEIINSTLKLEGDIYGFGTIKDSTVNAQMIRHYACENVEENKMQIVYKYCVSEKGNEKLIIDNSIVTLKGDLTRTIQYGIKDEYFQFLLKDGTWVPVECNEAGIIIRNDSTVRISNVENGIIASVRGIDVIDSKLYIDVEGSYGIGNMGTYKYNNVLSHHDYGLHVTGESIVDVVTKRAAGTPNLAFGFVKQLGYEPNNTIDLAPSATRGKYYVKFTGCSYDGDVPSSWDIPMTLGKYTRVAEKGGTYSNGVLKAYKEKMNDKYSQDIWQSKPAMECKYTILLESFPNLTGSVSLTGTIRDRFTRQVNACIGDTIGVNTDSIVLLFPYSALHYKWQYYDSARGVWVDIWLGSDIGYATESTYVPTTDILNKLIRVVVTANSHDGEVISSTATVKSKTGTRPGTGGTTLWGDANGDDKIDSKDIILLKKYIANLDPATGKSSVSVEAGADANGDGKIDSKDIILLKKYIANLDPSTGKSSVTLGPSK